MTEQIKSFLLGAAHVLDLGCTLNYPRKHVPVAPSHIGSAKDDAAAIRSDWEMVGRDLRYAMTTATNEQ